MPTSAIPNHLYRMAGSKAATRRDAPPPKRDGTELAREKTTTRFCVTSVGKSSDRSACITLRRAAVPVFADRAWAFSRLATPRGAGNLPGNSAARQGAVLVRHVLEAFGLLITGGDCEYGRIDGAGHESRKCRFRDPDARQAGGNHRGWGFLLGSFRAVERPGFDDVENGVAGQRQCRPHPRLAEATRDRNFLSSRFGRMSRRRTAALRRRKPGRV